MDFGSSDLQFLGDSECVAAADFDMSSNELTIEFTDGSRYVFYNVHPFVWYNLNRVTSKGWFFNRRIRNNYSYDRIG